MVFRGSFFREKWGYCWFATGFQGYYENFVGVKRRHFFVDFLYFRSSDTTKGGGVSLHNSTFTNPRFVYVALWFEVIMCFVL